jgi:nucleotide-binding universal stress UspA family protein
MEIHELGVGVDLVTDDSALLSCAAAFALAFKSRVTLYHINPEAPGLESHRGGRAYLELLEDGLRQRLETYRSRLRGRGLETAVRLLRGKPAHELAEHADCDLLVIGRSTHTDTDSRLTGVTARYLVRHPHRPLLIIPQPEWQPREDADRPFDRVLAATDFGPYCRRGLEVAEEVAARLAGTVELLHVLELPIPLPTLPGEPPLMLPMDVESNLRGDLEGRLADEAARVTRVSVSRRVEVAHRAARGIADVAAENLNTLTVLPTHARNPVSRWWLGSTTERLVELSKVPTLVLPPAPQGAAA